MSRLLHREAIETFPFERMARAMQAIGWRWFGHGVPSAPEIQLAASRLLRDLQNTKNADSLGSGGLVAYRDGTIGFEVMSGKKAACEEAWSAAKS